ncbi:hypothetical protein ACFCV3_16250 [Kribbella sp. NPDC056345]|uniref:hypothetical protein n=1 Tax=Kribbella sp. NPDC056345 TaxID=3345789 RepID=UPI0035DE4710
MIRRLLLAVTLTAALAACGSSSGEPEAEYSLSWDGPTWPTVGPPTPIIPTTPPLPEAKDGQNYEACNDGNCEVLIRKTAVITIGGEKNSATVKDGVIRLVRKNGSITLGGVGGVVLWGDGTGPLHRATLTFSEGDTVVMAIVTRR